MRESCQVSSGLEDKQQRMHALKMTGPFGLLLLCTACSMYSDSISDVRARPRHGTPQHYDTHLQ